MSSKMMRLADQYRRELRQEGRQAVGHKLYRQKDFTADEVARKNPLAVAVLEEGHRICKRCGAQDAELDEHPSCHDYGRFKRSRVA